MLAVLPREFARVVAQWSGFHRFCVTRLLGIRVIVEGGPQQAPALYALKHESFFEAIDLPHLLPHPVPFAKAELLRLPFWGWAARSYGVIPVARDEGAKALRAMVAAARTHANGRPLAIFPEGTRVPHGQRPALQSGFAGLYKLLGLPVVPVAVASGLVYHRWWKGAGTIAIRFGEAIPAGLPREVVESRVHAAINALNGRPE
ncbi:MAG: 1-acyl-sn-glycerol-3-phosphate acyltransferase [Novosphingobium sp.]|nr:1-acyl-sn-glycerol-3-phosphate acyltransferase [Novosphingobium sp.]